MTAPVTVSQAIDAIKTAGRSPAWSVQRGEQLNTCFRLSVGDAYWLFTIQGGHVTNVTPGPVVMPSYDFELHASEAHWQSFWQAKPPTGGHDLFAMLKNGTLRITGNLYPLMSHLLYFKFLLAAPRALSASSTDPQPVESNDLDADVHIEPIVGRYAHINIEGTRHRVYFEQAGNGIDLLCLHTAGSDGRQFRALLNDPDVLARYRVTVFDMPWHGKSSPPAGWQLDDYRLTSDNYVAQVMAIKNALSLDQPVVMGCSIGGRIVLHLAEQHASEFRAIIGLQSAPHVAPYYNVDWLHRADVHGGEVCGAVAYGLTAPGSPEDHRWETIWHYMQGGPGIFKGDLYFYKVDGDIRNRLDNIDPSKCPLYFLTGDYDFSCAPDDTRALAGALGDASVTIMPDMGHFPMSEHPDAFLDYLRPVLDDIAGTD